MKHVCDGDCNVFFCVFLPQFMCDVSPIIVYVAYSCGDLLTKSLTVAAGVAINCNHSLFILFD